MFVDLAVEGPLLERLSFLLSFNPLLMFFDIVVATFYIF
jgi:hypothetical protein